MKKNIAAIVAIAATLAATSAYAADTNVDISSILGTQKSATGSTASGTVAPAASTGTAVTAPATTPTTASTSLDSLLGTPPSTSATAPSAEKPVVTVQTRTATEDTVQVGKWNKDYRIELLGSGTFKRTDFTVVSVNAQGVEQKVTDFTVSDVKNELADATFISGKKIYLGLLQTADTVKVTVSGQSRMVRIIRFVNKDIGAIEEVYKFDFSAASAASATAVTESGSGAVATQPSGAIQDTGIVDDFALPFALGLIMILAYAKLNRKQDA